MIRRPASPAKPLLLCLAAVVFAVSAVPLAAHAMPLPAAPPSSADSPLDREADLAKIQATLETRAIQQRLVDHGLTPREASVKVNGLSDEQVHLLAANIDALQPGGRGSNDIIIILLLVLLIVILI